MILILRVFNELKLCRFDFDPVVFSIFNVLTSQAAIIFLLQPDAGAGVTSIRL